MNEWKWPSWYWFFHLEFKFLISFPRLLFCGQLLSPSGSSAPGSSGSHPPHPQSKQCRARPNRDPEAISQSGSWAQVLFKGYVWVSHLPLWTSAMKQRKCCRPLRRLFPAFGFSQGEAPLELCLWVEIPFLFPYLLNLNKPNASSPVSFVQLLEMLEGVSHFFFRLSVSSVAQLYPTLCNAMDCGTPGFPVHHQLLKPAQAHVYQVGDAIQPSHPLLSPSPPTFNLSQHQILFHWVFSNGSQHQGLFRWVSSSHQVAKVLKFQLHHQSFHWIFKTDFL